MFDIVQKVGFSAKNSFSVDGHYDFVFIAGFEDYDNIYLSHDGYAVNLGLDEGGHRFQEIIQVIQNKGFCINKTVFEQRTSQIIIFCLKSQINHKFSPEDFNTHGKTADPIR